MTSSLRRFFDLGFRPEALEAARQETGSTRLVPRPVSTASWPALFAGLALGLVVAGGALRVNDSTMAIGDFTGSVGQPMLGPDTGSAALVVDTASREWKLLLRAMALQRARAVAQADLDTVSARDSSTGYSLARAQIVRRITEIDDSLRAMEPELARLGVIQDSGSKYAAAAMPDSLLLRVRAPMPAWVWWVIVPLGAIFGLAALATLALVLRQRANPLGWHLVCYVLVATGIFSRQEFLSTSPAEAATKDLLFVVKNPHESPSSPACRILGSKSARRPPLPLHPRQDRSQNPRGPGQ